MTSVLGIDIGGTKIAAGIVSFPNGVLARAQLIPTLSKRGGEAVLANVESLIDSYSTAEKVAAIGIGVCELVDQGGNLASDNCVKWLGLPVRERLSRFAPVTIEADVRAAALAESKFGAGRPFSVFLFVTIGTGIGCCLMQEGRPYLGAHGLTGTMASSPLFGGPETLEDIASGSGLAAQYTKQFPNQNVTAKELFTLAGQGNSDAIKILERAGEALGATLGMLVGTLDPEAIVIGGGLGVAGGLYWENLQAATRHHIWSSAQRNLPILQASTGANAGVIGAATAAWIRKTR